MKATIVEDVRRALAEDIGPGDITSELIAVDAKAKAQVISRDEAIICGKDWFDEVFNQLDPALKITWLVDDGDKVNAGDSVCQLEGFARSILTGERSALNFLQTLSGTTTTTHRFVECLSQSHTQLLDTRKTLPGLRLAQKYAVRCGGGKNHRMGLYDAFLIKENHIAAHGSITAAVAKARHLHPEKTLEVEVENIDEFREALAAGADIIMLDNFSIVMLQEAVKLNRGQVKLELSGNVTLENIHKLALIGIDYISVGALTKHLSAIDFSMRFE